jgi:hypothetical protein
MRRFRQPAASDRNGFGLFLRIPRHSDLPLIATGLRLRGSIKAASFVVCLGYASAEERGSSGPQSRPHESRWLSSMDATPARPRRRDYVKCSSTAWIAPRRSPVRVRLAPPHEQAASALALGAIDGLWQVFWQVELGRIVRPTKEPTPRPGVGTTLAKLSSHVKATAEDIQALAKAVVHLGRADPNFREDVIGPPRVDEVRVEGPLWYRRHCISVSRALLAAAEAKGLEGVSLVFGQFQDPTDPKPLRHVWPELEDGTIVDPTSAQMGGPECAIVRPEDPEYGYYHSRGSWQEGDPD